MILWKDLLWPRRCLLCEQLLYASEQGPVCPQCRAEEYLITGRRCIICSRPVAEDAFICMNCTIHRTKVPGYSAFSYYGAIQAAIHRLKYDAAREIGPQLAGLAWQYAGDRLKGATVLIPIPAHKDKKRLRGYDQAEDIAVTLSRLSGVPELKLIQRVKKTEALSQLGAKERREMLKGAFAVDQTAAAKVPETGDLVIIDDIYTSGSTIEAAASVIRPLFPDREIRFFTVSLKIH